MKKPKLVKTDMDAVIADLVYRTDHRTLAVWAADCAARVLPHFEIKYPGDDRPRKAIEAARRWAQTGEFRMVVVRGASLAAHAAARQAGEDDAARSAARAAGQAIATAHVPAHAIAAAVYAATTVRDAAELSDAVAAATGEREWQYRHLIEISGSGA